MPRFVLTDGGRRDAGFHRKAKGDCVCRAISVATGKPYHEVHEALAAASLKERRTKRRKIRSHPDQGIHRATYGRYLAALGWKWVPTMHIGAGCRVHLRRDELPPGRLIVRVSGHLTTVIDGMIHDTHDPSRGGTRCVYGYWRPG